MAISNFQEKLLFFTQQKSRLSLQLSDVQMKQLSATKNVAQKQQEFNAQLSALYYDEECGYGTDAYGEILLQLQNEHEFELSQINAWESQLDMEKENLETQINEIQTYENTWQKLLAAAIKADFVYGGIGGGK
ncbi:hypothetical protein IJ472_04665 [bacterium]|nr:hypothetical protein [bacterium]